MRGHAQISVFGRSRTSGRRSLNGSAAQVGMPPDEKRLRGSRTRDGRAPVSAKRNAVAEAGCPLRRPAEKNLVWTPERSEMRFCFHHRGVWGPAYTSPGRGSPKPKLIFVFFNARLREERRRRAFKGVWLSFVCLRPHAATPTKGRAIRAS